MAAFGHNCSVVAPKLPAQGFLSCLSSQPKDGLARGFRGEKKNNVAAKSFIGSL
jgi:hypothetical protein